MEDNDVHEWEFLPVDDGFLQIHDDHHTGNNIFSRRYTPYHNHHLFLTNYFVFPSLRSSLNLTDPPPSDQISPAELELESPKPDDETVSQVSFKKLLTRENEFADMKLDSPKKISSSSSRTVLSQIDLGGLIEYDSEIPTNRDDTKSDHPKNSDGWKRKRNLTGLGAICSFGVVAAATFCFIIFGIQRKNNRGESKLQFQIFSDDKVHHKNSISMPVMTTGAHITFNLEC